MSDTKRNNADENVLIHSQTGSTKGDISVKERLKQVREASEKKDNKEKE